MSPGEVGQAIAGEVEETNVTVVEGDSHYVVVVIGYGYSAGGFKVTADFSSL